MAIDKTGKFWVGDEAGDLHEYLSEFSEGNYPVDEFRLARCDCGSVEFQLEADANEGAARRTCFNCKKQHFICDSGEFWEEAEPENWACFCKSTAGNIGVGFAMRKGKKDVHWIYLGVRCAKCGLLGCFADWKIDYSPSLHLMDQV